jgi:hypothetical protein
VEAKIAVQVTAQHAEMAREAAENSAVGVHCVMYCRSKVPMGAALCKIRFYDGGLGHFPFLEVEFFRNVFWFKVRLRSRSKIKINPLCVLRLKQRTGISRA